MIIARRYSNFISILLGLAVAAALTVFAPSAATAQVTALKQAIAEAAARDKDIAAFYKANDYKPIWVGKSGKDRQRRAHFLKALNSAGSLVQPLKSRPSDRSATTALKSAA